MSQKFSLAHLSDLHLPLTNSIPLEHFRAKRLLGLTNWRRNRHHVHRYAALDTIIADVRAQRPDHIAVTGDLVNFGLPSEHRAAQAWLKSLGTPDVVTVVPGNHDAYVAMHRDPGFLRWAAYMAGLDNEPPTTAAAGTFPFVRKLGPVALIGLCSALPTPVFTAFGKLGAAQRQRLGEVLRETGAQGLIRIILVHHPVHDYPKAWRNGLHDAGALRSLIADHGADLVLHGHLHRHMRHEVPRSEGRSGSIPVIGVASASAAIAGHGDLAAYHLFRITRDGPVTRMEMIVRGLDRADGVVRELSRDVVLDTSCADR